MFDHKKFHISKQSHERAIKTSRTYTAYATAVLHDYFKSSVTMFCTCIGSSKGKAADGHERASLPKVALEAFLGKKLRCAMHYAYSNACPSLFSPHSSNSVYICIMRIM
jgi:hypothetical protein